MGCLSESWLPLQNSNCKWATALSILVIIVYFSVTPRDAGERGHCFPCSFKREATGAEVTFHDSITGNFMIQHLFETNVLQLFTHPQHSEWFSTLSAIIYLWGQHCCWTETNILLKNLLFFKSLHFPQRLLPLALTAATCVLSNSTYKLSISADMIVEIQVTKLLTKLFTESHWR